MAKAKVKTKAPSGLSLKRTNNKFVATWKINDKDYGDGQVAQYKIGSGRWLTLSGVGKKTTSKAFTVTAGSFYPSSHRPKLKKVQFRVKGNRNDTSTIKYNDSAWTVKAFDIKTPRVPSITTEVMTYPKTKFSWTVKRDDSDAYWFSLARYESILVMDSNETNGEKAFKLPIVGTTYTGTKSASDPFNVEITEDSAQLASGQSYTRWFRVRSEGPAGNSSWAYARHVYAMSNQPKITDYKVTENTSASGYTCKVWYDCPFSESRPIADITVEYALATPDPGMECPDGASWQTGVTSLTRTENNRPDTTGGAIFSIDSLLGLDQCLFIRVNTTYDNKTTYGTPVLVDKGKLSAPSGLSVAFNSQTYNATVTATNNSAVQDSFLIVKYLSGDDPDGVDIGTIPHGQTSAVIQCPEWTSTSDIRIGVYAATGTMEAPLMVSDVVDTGGTVPVAPANVTAMQANITGTIRVTWDWTWTEATAAELSWADHIDAWESTDEPETYTVTKMYSPAWNISGLDTGQTWYVRVRLIAGSGDNATYGAYSETKSVLLSSAPAIPSLTISDTIITEDETITASWTYTTTDGTAQAFAEIAEVTTEGGELVYTPLAQVQSEQQATISAKDAGWQNGETHTLAVRVTSASGRNSDGWSNFESVTVAAPLVCDFDVTDTSLVGITVTDSTDEEGQPVSRIINALTEMPLEIIVPDPGASGTATVAIERTEAYHVERPDETDFNGYEGETIALIDNLPAGSIYIDNDDLIGHLDDGADYRIVVTISDKLGQSADASVDFEVQWEKQAAIPDATAVIDNTEGIAILTPVATENIDPTCDVCDIYRLSIDKPELIYRGAEFGTQYVDPYPAIGENGGHRFVMRTPNGDYITEDNEFAWIDTAEEYNTGVNIIEFGGGRVEIEYDIDLDYDWGKDFKETQYLGGSVTGDWGQAVSRSGNLQGNTIVIRDAETIQSMRRLAAYPGICHVRTKDGSSFSADVQVQEKRAQNTAHKVAAFTLKITRVDTQDLDGMTYTDWQKTHDEE